MRPKEEARTTALLRSLHLYPITFPVAELAGLLKRDHSKKESPWLSPALIFPDRALVKLFQCPHALSVAI